MKDIYISEDPNYIYFGNAKIELKFNKSSGLWQGLSDKRTSLSLIGHGNDFSLIDFHADGNWVCLAEGKLAAFSHGVKKQHNKASLALNYQLKDWQFTCSYCLRPQMSLVERKFDLTYLGSGNPKVDSINFQIFGIALGNEEDSFYSILSQYPPEKVYFNRLKPRKRVDEQHSYASTRCLIVHNGKLKLSLVASFYSETEPGHLTVEEGKGFIHLNHYLNVLVRMRNRETMGFGTQFIEVVLGNWQEALKAVQGIFELVGLSIPKDTPDWAARAIIYSAHPGGTIDSGFQDVGGFKEFAGLLPYLHDLGVNTLWLLPIWHGEVYAPVDYYKLDSRMGTEEDFRSLVEKAHKLGIKVLGDLIPHGPLDSSNLHKKHPDWISLDERGKMIYWWGCLSCDYANEGWQKYMADVAAYWVRKFGLDGYRVDCAAGGPANWDEKRPYRPSQSGLWGGLRLLSEVRRRMTKVKRGAVLLPEAAGPLFFQAGDFVYDFPFYFSVLRRFVSESPEDWCKNASQWLENQKYYFPKKANWMRFLENHDTIRAQKYLGLGPHRALMALCTFIKGVPLVYHDQEVGSGPYFRKLFTIRSRLEELNYGEAFYTQVKCDHKAVFTCLRTFKGKNTVIAINLNSNEVNCLLSLPIKDMKINPKRRYIIYDAFKGEFIKPTGKDYFAGKELSGIRLSIEPYSPKVVVIRQYEEKKGLLVLFPEITKKPQKVEGRAMSLRTPSVRETPEEFIIENAIYRLSLDKTKGGLIKRLSLIGGSKEGLIKRIDFEEGKRKMFIGEERISLSKVTNPEIKYQPRLPGGQKTKDKLLVTVTGGIERLTGNKKIAVMKYAIHYSLDSSEIIKVTYQFMPQMDIKKINGTLIHPISLNNMTHWFVNTAEGLLYDEFVQRHPIGKGEGFQSWRYWHRVGDRLWEAATLPLHFYQPYLGALNEDTGEFIAFSDINASAPQWFQNTYLTEKWSDFAGVNFVFAWLDSKMPVDLIKGETYRVGYSIQVGLSRRPFPVRPSLAIYRPVAPFEPTVSIQGTNYMVENKHYKIVIAKSGGGSIRWFYSKPLLSQNLISGSDIYTDYGIYPDWRDPMGNPQRTLAACREDTEPEVNFIQENGKVRLSFTSRLRRADWNWTNVAWPPTEYRISYTFDASPKIRINCAVRPKFRVENTKAFLAHTVRLPGVACWTINLEKGLISKGVGSSEERVWESRIEPLKIEEPYVKMENLKGDLIIRFDQIKSQPQMQNIFLFESEDNIITLFFAWLDGLPTDISPRWYELSYTLEISQKAK